MKSAAFVSLLLLITHVESGLRADVTVNIVGSNTTRSALFKCVLNALTNETAAWEGSSLHSASKACFKGSLAGVSGTTTINCKLEGSVRGVEDLGWAATSGWISPIYATFSTATSAPYGNGYATGAAPKTSVVPTLAVSDVYQGSTQSVLAVDEIVAAVVPFKFVANESAPTALVSISEQLHEATYSIGSQLLSMFTSNSADSRLVYVVGRDAGSGTRTIRLAETGYGITKPVTQWRATCATGVVSDLRLWPSTVEEASPPANMVNDPALQGNGGYVSGDSIATIMGCTSSSVNIRDATNGVLASSQSIVLLACLGLSDASQAINSGAKGLSYGGFAYSPPAVREGSYTLWSYLHIFNVTGSLASDEIEVRDAIHSGLAAVTTDLNGVECLLDLSTMNVSRSEDGGLVGP